MSNVIKCDAIGCENLMDKPVAVKVGRVASSGSGYIELEVECVYYPPINKAVGPTITTTHMLDSALHVCVECRERAVRKWVHDMEKAGRWIKEDTKI